MHYDFQMMEEFLVVWINVELFLNLNKFLIVEVQDYFYQQ
jgi:hypothetical protein